jgi:hypothetical protein
METVKVRSLSPLSLETHVLALSNLPPLLLSLHSSRDPPFPHPNHIWSGGQVTTI